MAKSALEIVLVDGGGGHAAASAPAAMMAPAASAIPFGAAAASLSSRGGMSVGVAAGAAALGPVGIAAAGVAGAFGLAASAAVKLGGVFAKQAEDLKGLSAPLAQASAETEIRRMRAQADRAERLGPDLAKFERFRARGEEAMTRAVTELQSWLLKAFAELEPYLSRGVAVVETLPSFLEIIIGLVEAISATLAADFEGAAKAREKIDKAAEKILRALLEGPPGEKDPLLDVFLEQFLKSGDHLRTT